MNAREDRERAALVALLRQRPSGQSWPALTVEVAESGSALAVWRRHTEAAPSLFDAEEDDPVESALADIHGWREQGLTLLTILDAEYPAQLREVHEMPPLLFARGQVKEDDRGVSVVGSRAASPAALAFAADVASRLVSEGLSVLAGLAAGVDTAAHTAALASGGRTVAFIGIGIRRHYPAENRALQDRVATEGLLLSQFWPDAPPQRHTFLMRNAVMSGYGRATVVVAAGEKSGTRTQARLAVEHGRPVILTPQVAGATTWGAALVGRPGVYVASSPAEVIDIVRELTRPLCERVASLVA